MIPQGFPTHSIALRMRNGSKGHICQFGSPESALNNEVVRSGKQKGNTNFIDECITAVYA